jgi:protein gp37
MNNTPIEWADMTVNPWIGCSKVHRGCDHCYAVRETNRKINNHKLSIFEREAARKALRISNGKLDWTGEVTFLGQRLKAVAARGNARIPKRIFVQSLGDVAHPWVFPTHFQYMCNEIHEADRKRVDHGRQPDTWIFLSKRPADMDILFRQWMRKQTGGKRLPDNWHFGVSVCDQPTTDKLVPDLLKMSDIARVLFVSAEPALGFIDVRPWLPHASVRPDIDVDIDGNAWPGGRAWGPFLSGVICGGESGPGARPMHPDIPRGLRDQCVETGTPFMFKQWGEFREEEAALNIIGDDHPIFRDCRASKINRRIRRGALQVVNDTTMVRIGKKWAGRELDGRTWDQVPEVRIWQH